MPSITSYGNSDNSFTEKRRVDWVRSCQAGGHYSTNSGALVVATETGNLNFRCDAAVR